MMTSMASIAGIMNASAPNTTSAAADAATPATDPAWLGSWSHWSRKMTVNSAVMANETPSMSVGIRPPKTPPSVQPATQEDWFSRLTANMKRPRSTPSGTRAA